MARRDTARARAIEGAISLALASPEWAAADNDAARAQVLSAAVLDTLDAMYSPATLAKAYARVLRDRRIRDVFDGRNHHELALRFDLDVRQVRRIVRPRRSRK